VEPVGLTSMVVQLVKVMAKQLEMSRVVITKDITRLHRFKRQVNHTDRNCSGIFGVWALLRINFSFLAALTLCICGVFWPRGINCPPLTTSLNKIHFVLWTVGHRAGPVWRCSVSLKSITIVKELERSEAYGVIFMTMIWCRWCPQLSRDSVVASEYGL